MGLAHTSKMDEQIWNEFFENPEKLADFLEAHGGFETTTRATFLEELRRMRPVPGHDMHEEAIPEKSPLYRMLQKRYFFGFGAYG